MASSSVLLFIPDTIRHVGHARDEGTRESRFGVQSQSV